MKNSSFPFLGPQAFHIAEAGTQHISQECKEFFLYIYTQITGELIFFSERRDYRNIFYLTGSELSTKNKSDSHPPSRISDLL